MRHVVILVSTLAVLVGLPDAVVYAQGDDATVSARKYFESGKVLYKQGSYKEAVVEFQKAYSLFPNGALLYNIAKSYEKLDDIPQALRSFKEYLRAAPNADDSSDVQASIKILEKRLSDKGVQQVRVYTTPAGAQVSINADVKGSTPFSTELAPGKYFLTLTKTGFRPVDREFEVTGSGSLDLELPLEYVKLARQPAPGQAGQLAGKPAAGASATLERKHDDHRTWAWVTAGAGVAAIATGGVLHYLAASDYDTWKGLPETDPGNAGLKDSATAKLTAAYVLYGVGAAALIGGVVWYFIGGDSKAAAGPAPQVRVTPGFAGMPGIGLDGRW